MKLPVIFAGHGSPMIALEDNELTKEFQKIGERVVSEFEKPKAILSFSAHWFTRGTYVQSDPEPRQVYDMYGFPKELYEVQYHPKGCQELTDDILALLPDISINDDWGIEGPQNAYDIGKALAPLREKGYLLLGSGNIVHNLRRLEWDNPNGSPQADRFDAFITGLVKKERQRKNHPLRRQPRRRLRRPDSRPLPPLTLYTRRRPGRKTRDLQQRKKHRIPLHDRIFIWIWGEVKRGNDDGSGEKPNNLAALGNCTPFCHFVSVCVILVPRQVFSILMDIIERTPYRFHLRFVFKSLLIT